MRDLPPARGELWDCDFGNPVGHEQGMRRPCLVVSHDRFNSGPAELVAVLPCTTKNKKIPWHVRIDPGEGGADRTSFIMCDQIRVVSFSRLFDRRGEIQPSTLERIEEMLRIFLDL